MRPRHANLAPSVAPSVDPGKPALAAMLLTLGPYFPPALQALCCSAQARPSA